MAWKMIYLARRNNALAPEQFADAWRGHSALGAGCTNVRDKVLSVTQCARVLAAPPLPGSSTRFDGVNLLQLRDLQAATDIWSDAETLAIMRPDEPCVFSGYVRDFTLVCEEQVHVDKPRTGTCLVAFLRRRTGLSQDDWHRQWSWSIPTGALLVEPFTSARRVVHNRVHLPPPPGYEFDSVVEWWFTSACALRQAIGCVDVRQHLPASLCSCVDLAQSVFMFTHVTHCRP